MSDGTHGKITRDTDITGAQAQNIIRNMSLEIFPGLRYGE